MSILGMLRSGTILSQTWPSQAVASRFISEYRGSTTTKKLTILILGFYVPKPLYEYEAHLSGQLQINFDQLGFFTVHPMHSTRVFLHFAPIEMQLPERGFDPAPSGLAAQHHHGGWSKLTGYILRLFTQFQFCHYCLSLGAIHSGEPLLQ